MKFLRRSLIMIARLTVLLCVVNVRPSRTPTIAREMGAIKTIVTLHTAEAQYFSQFGKFAGLPDLASADLIFSHDLVQTGERDGYKFTLARTSHGYAINANPAPPGTPPRRSFFSDETLEIHSHYGLEPATAFDQLLK